MVGNPLAFILTPDVVKKTLASSTVGLLAGLEDEGVQLDFDEEMDGARGGITAGVAPLLRSWGVNTDVPRYVT